jgi:hypothetical protein
MTTICPSTGKVCEITGCRIFMGEPCTLQANSGLHPLQREIKAEMSDTNKEAVKAKFDEILSNCQNNIVTTKDVTIEWNIRQAMHEWGNYYADQQTADLQARCEGLQILARKIEMECIGCGNEHQIIQSILTIINTAIQKGEIAIPWIDVTVRQPEEFQEVAFIVSSDDKNYNGRKMGGRYQGLKGKGEDAYYEFTTPGNGWIGTHWMPLPDLIDKTGD